MKLNNLYLIEEAACNIALAIRSETGKHTSIDDVVELLSPLLSSSDFDDLMNYVVGED
jgi:hypothetical protein